MRHKIYFGILLCIASPCLIAATQMWKIDSAKSSLTFTATQNDAPVVGEFKSFNGEIAFDSQQLSTSSVKIVVNMGSLSTSYGDLTTTLATPDWFNTAAFPKATFAASTFKHLTGNHYEAQGMLTIRDKSVATKLEFSSDDFAKSSVVVLGETVIKRRDFGVGQGEWAGTDEVKDQVKVQFKLLATKI